MSRGPPISTLFPYTTLFRSYVLDGVVIDPGPKGYLTGVNPNDIESIEVLKEPAETALYGLRGANGVIIIKRSEEHTSELQSLTNLVCRLLLEKKKQKK